VRTRILPEFSTAHRCSECVCSGASAEGRRRVFQDAQCSEGECGGDRGWGDAGGGADERYASPEFGQIVQFVQTVRDRDSGAAWATDMHSTLAAYLRRTRSRAVDGVQVQDSIGNATIKHMVWAASRS
jgi:hypothetical protein